MIHVNNCPDCGEPICISELSARIGVGGANCRLCHARLIAAYGSLILALGIVFTYPYEPSSWVISGFLIMWAAFWSARCYSIKHKNLAGQIMARGSIGLFILVFAFGILSFAVNQQRIGFESMTWPRTAGTITNSSLQFKTSEKFGRQYYPLVQYEYKAGERSLQGNLIKFNFNDSLNINYYQTEKEAQKIVDHYKRGGRCNVFYNSLRPNICCLEPGVNWLIFSLFAVCSATLIFCTASICIQGSRHIAAFSQIAQDLTKGIRK